MYKTIVSSTNHLDRRKKVRASERRLVAVSKPGHGARELDNIVFAFEGRAGAKSHLEVSEKRARSGF